MGKNERRNEIAEETKRKGVVVRGRGENARQWKQRREKELVELE